MNKKLQLLFKDLCCSRCKEDFSDESVEIVREEDSMVVVKLVCRNCLKSFGIAFLGISEFEVKHQDEEKTVLRIQDELPPITKDDVLDAHKFFKNLDEHWQKYI